MKKRKITGKKLIRFFAGLVIIQLAVASFLQLNIGSDSFTVFTQGISRVLHISVGAANLVETLVLLIAVFFLDRSQFHIGMVLSVAFAGVILNSMTKVTAFILPANPHPILLFVEFMLTCCVVSIGFPLLKSAGIGVAPNDALYLAVSKRLKKPYGIVRICIDACYLVLGFACGGVVGVGTLICVAVLGPMMQFVMTHWIKQEEEEEQN